MDHTDPATGAPSHADLAVRLDQLADQIAATPRPPRPTITEQPAAAFGDRDVADAYAGFVAAYAETADHLAADHDATINHLRATAAAYRAGDAETAEQIITAGPTAATAEHPAPRTPPE